VSRPLYLPFYLGKISLSISLLLARSHCTFCSPFPFLLLADAGGLSTSFFLSTAYLVACRDKFSAFRLGRSCQNPPQFVSPQGGWKLCRRDALVLRRAGMCTRAVLSASRARVLGRVLWDGANSGGPSRPSGTMVDFFRTSCPHDVSELSCNVGADSSPVCRKSCSTNLQKTLSRKKKHRRPPLKTRAQSRKHAHLVPLQGF